MKPPDPRAILREAGFNAKKSWGQNFLLDQGVLANIADATKCCNDDPVVEIGAGLGALTYHLLQRGGRVVAVERDRDLVPLLKKALAWAEQLEVEEADAGKLNYGALATRLGGPFVVAGNLPYQLSSRIIVSLAEVSQFVRRAVLLVQLEVAQRLCATPGNKTYGLLSVLAQRAFDAELLRKVPPSVFHPQPKVTSAIIRLTPHGNRRDGESDLQLVRTARAAFSSRRKTLRNALSGGLNAPRDAVEAAIRSAGLDPGCRAETLSIEQFAQLADALHGEGGALPSDLSREPREEK